MTRLPTIFISHGAPTLPIDPSMPSAEFASFATRFERPRSILMLSAHWGTAQPVASVAEQPETIHDFYGFPRTGARLSRLRASLSNRKPSTISTVFRGPFTRSSTARRVRRSSVSTPQRC